MKSQSQGGLTGLECVKVNNNIHMCSDGNVHMCSDGNKLALCGELKNQHGINIFERYSNLQTTHMCGSCTLSHCVHFTISPNPTESHAKVMTTLSHKLGITSCINRITVATTTLTTVLPSLVTTTSSPDPTRYAIEHGEMTLVDINVLCGTFGAVLLLLLAVMTIGWVCTCCVFIKKSRKTSLRSRESPIPLPHVCTNDTSYDTLNNTVNPIVTPTTNNTLSTNYSALFVSHDYETVTVSHTPERDREKYDILKREGSDAGTLNHIGEMDSTSSIQPDGKDPNVQEDELHLEDVDKGEECDEKSHVDNMVDDSKTTVTVSCSTPNDAV